MTKIVVLDGYAMNPGDLPWQPLQKLGDLQIYDLTAAEDILIRSESADILLTNKTPLSKETLRRLPRLRFISVMATGYNVVDTAAAREQGILVSNVPGYAAGAVAQHVFALLLAFASQVSAHAQDVWKGGWQASPHWSYTLSPTFELAGKTMGILGLGSIGRKVAEIALAFDMKVIACHKHPQRDQLPGILFVDLETLFRRSDVLSLHVPLNAQTAGIVNKHHLQLMKPSALLINTSRGGLISEADLRDALGNGTLAGAALDVLSVEPPTPGNPLIGCKNCLVTPHNAWATREARQRLLLESAENVSAFIRQRPRNLVN
jgi:glycerate dehydrogenase